MNLSNRATEYLKSLKRDFKWTSNLEETKAYLEHQGNTPFEEYLRFQTLFSGYELTIKDDPGRSFSAFLFSKEQIAANENLLIEKVGNRYIIDCGTHKTAQFNFFITDRGEVCTIDDNDLPNILYSSFEKMLEAYALRNEIHKWTSNPYYFEVKHLDDLTSIMNNEFQIIPECSDQYTTWWKNEHLIAVKGIWLDRHDAYFHVYGTDRDSCDQLIERLKTNKILK